MNMKNVLIYFRKDALLEQGNMPSQSRETCLPKAGKDTSPGRGGVSTQRAIQSSLALLGLLAFLLTSCSTTKNLPEGAVLYTGIKKIEVKNEDKTKPGEAALEEVEAALAYPPNNALLGSCSIRVPFPFGLWVYNAFVNKKGKVGKLSLIHI